MRAEPLAKIQQSPKIRLRKITGRAEPAGDYEKNAAQAELRQHAGDSQVIFRTIVKSQFQVWKERAGLIGANMSGDLFQLLPEAPHRQVVKFRIAMRFGFSMNGSSRMR